MKPYHKFNDAAYNSTDITNPTHQSPHAPIARSIPWPCRAIILHQSQDVLQRSVNCNRDVVLHGQRQCSQFNQYQKLHAPIAVRTDRHIPHQTAPCDKPWRRICLLTLLWPQLSMGMKFLGWIMLDRRQQGGIWMKMKGRQQGSILAYQSQSQSQRGYIAQLY